MRQTETGTLYNIQFLRGFSALLVVFYHLAPVYAKTGLPQFGGSGVDIFFVISGFIMTHMVLHRPTTPSGFVMNRIKRIVPLYWVMTLSLFSVALIAPDLLKGTRADWSELVKSLLFIPFMKANGAIDPVLFVGWTLNYEMFFYALFAMGLIIPDRRWSFAVTASAVMVLVAGGWFMMPGHPITRFYTEPIMLEFVFGMIIGVAYRDCPAAVDTRVKALVLVFGTAAALSVVLLPVYFHGMERMVICGLPAMAAVASALALECWGWRITSPVSLRLGTASYAIYLTHLFVTEVAVKIAQKFDGSAAAASLITLIAAIGACLLGLLIFRYVETPLKHLVSPVRRDQPITATPVKAAW